MADRMSAILAEFKSAKDELVAAVQKQDAEMESVKSASQKTGTRVDAAHDRLVEITSELKTATERLDEWEKKAARSELGSLFGGAGGGGIILSPGAQVVKSEAYAGLFGTRGELKNERMSRPVEIGSFFAGRKASDVENAVFNDGAGGAAGGAATDYYRVPEIYSSPIESLRLRDLLRVARISTDSVKFVRETGYRNLSTRSTSATSAGQKVVEVSSIAGFFPGQKVTIDDGTSPEQFTIDTISAAGSSLTATVNLATAHDTAAAVYASTFAGTAETGLKPGSEILFEFKINPVVTLAHGIPAAKQILEDAQRLEAFINNKMTEGLKITEDYHILYGNGGDTELTGILRDAAINSINWSAMPTNSTKVDTIRRAMTLARLAHYPATGAALNPVDWEDMETAKGSDLHYLYTSMATPRGPVVWALPVAETTAINEGEGLVGAFGLGAQLHDRMDATVQSFDQHKDFAARNMIYMLAEERLALEISRPQAFTKCSFDAAPA